MNPYKCKPFIKAHELLLEQQDTLMYRQGQYFAEAIMSTVCNALAGKNGKKYEYPKKPYGISKELSQKEIKKQRELVMASLQAMKINHDLQKKNNGKG